MMSPCSLLCQPKLSSNAITEGKALQELNFQPLVLAAAHCNPLRKWERCTEQTGTSAKTFQRGLFQTSSENKPNLSHKYSDGTAIKRGSRRSKAKVNCFPGGQPRWAVCSCVSVHYMAAESQIWADSGPDLAAFLWCGLKSFWPKNQPHLAALGLSQWNQLTYTWGWFSQIIHLNSDASPASRCAELRPLLGQQILATWSWSSADMLMIPMIQHVHITILRLTHLFICGIMFTQGLDWYFWHYSMVDVS